MKSESRLEGVPRGLQMERNSSYRHKQDRTVGKCISSMYAHETEGVFPPKAMPTWMGSIPAWSPEGDKLAFSWQHKCHLVPSRIRRQSML